MHGHGPERTASAIVRPGERRSDVHRVRNAGPLRILSPRAAGSAAWLVTSSYGGGLVDGDHVAFDVTVDAGATCVVTTQASTKIYKGTSSQETRVRVHGDGALLCVPDPVVPFRDAAFRQVTAIEMDAASSLVLCDVLTAGRVAFGERWNATSLDSTLSITVDGKRLLHDRMLLVGDVAAKMRKYDALATLVVLGPRVRDTVTIGDGVVAMSPLGDGVIVRLAGERIDEVIAVVRALLAPACQRLGESPWARKY
jgi:urease accessory protein